MRTKEIEIFQQKYAKTIDGILDQIMFFYVDEKSAKSNICEYLEKIYNDGYLDGEKSGDLHE